MPFFESKTNFIMQAKSGDQLGLPKQNTDFKIQKKKLVFAQEAVLKAEQAHF